MQQSRGRAHVRFCNDEMEEEVEKVSRRKFRFHVWPGPKATGSDSTLFQSDCETRDYLESENRDRKSLINVRDLNILNIE